MTSHLMIDDASGPNWRIPDAADPIGLLDTLRDAMANETVIEVAVQTDEAEPKHVKLLFNGAAVGTVALVTL